MIAILTKYIPATDTRAARIKAYTCNGHKVFVSIDYDLDDVGRHAKAARKLIETQLAHSDADKPFTYGGIDMGYVFTFINSTINLPREA